MPKIQINNISKYYETGRKTIAALDGFCLDVEENEIVSLVGQSGCGKTTLINLVAGFSEPTSGSILIDGMEVRQPGKACGVVFQADSVFPWMTVRQNVGYALRFNSLPKADKEQVINRYLSLVRLSDFAERWPRELSGGMRKRVEVARAYTSDPEVLLLDEPFGSLDVITKEEMQTLLMKIWEVRKKSVLFVTHDVEEAIFLSNRVAVMSARPGHIKAVFEVPFGMPRSPAIKLDVEFLQIRKLIVSEMEDTVEVEQALVYQ